MSAERDVTRSWLKLNHAVSSHVRLHGWDKRSPDSFTAAPGAHDAIEIALVISGAVKYAVGSREIAARAGDVVVVPRGVEHATTFATEVRAVALWLGAEFVAEIAEAMGPAASRASLLPAVLSGKTARVNLLVGLIEDEVKSREAGHTRAAEALCESVVIEVLRSAPRSEERGARDPRVARAIAQMNASYKEALGIDDLAKTAGMSRFHFSRLFRDEIGQAPYQYLLRVRIARATELLRGGHHSVTEAALESGFTDLSRFASMFKKQTGKRPSEIARARSA